jgi:serine/threonine protein kinase
MTTPPNDSKATPNPTEPSSRLSPDETNTLAPTLGGQSSPVAGSTTTPILAPAQEADEIGRLGKYRVLKQLGRGGMGAVFLAEDPQLKRTVALKVMLPEVAASQSSRERFLREARAAAAIEHENIVTIYEVAEDRGAPFLAMQFLKGMSLDDYIKKGKPFTWAQIIRIGREIARGLDAAHQRGLIHRDIKPANIWLDATAGGRVRILDFGLARPSEGNTSLTQSGLIVGTPTYMAPEQARAASLDGRADLYSLGCVLYRLCTGRVPFDGPDTMATLVTAAVDAPKPPREINPEVPAELNELILRLLEKDPAKRPGSAKAVAETLRTMLTGSANANIAKSAPAADNIDVEPDEKTEAVPATPRKRRKKRAKRSLLWPAALGGVVALAGIVLAVVLFARKNEGTLRLEALDDDVQVFVEQNGTVVKVMDKNSGPDAKLPRGDYHLRVSDPAQFKLSKDSVSLARGKDDTARIERIGAMAQASPNKPLAVAPAKPPVQEPTTPPPAKDFRRILWRAANGRFENSGGKNWLETNNGNSTCQWEEKNRTDDYVELFDAKRSLTVRLNNDRQMDNANGKAAFRKVRDGEWEKVFTGLTKAQFNEVFVEYKNLKPNAWRPIYIKGYDGKEERLDITWRSALTPGWSLHSHLSSQRELAAKNAEATKFGTPIIICESRYKINGQEFIAAIWSAGERNYWKQSDGPTFFEQKNGDQWFAKTPVRTYQYVEKGRNDEFIDLFDQTNNQRVRLYFDHREVFTNNQFKSKWDGKWEAKPAAGN